MTSDGRVVGVPDLGRSDRERADSERADTEAVPTVDDVVAAIEAGGGGRARVADPETLAAADLRAIVAPGETALRRVATASPDAPILPVAVDPGVRSVRPADIERAVEDVLDGRTDAVAHTVVDVRVDGTRAGRFLRDASLLTAEPARISEFAIDSDALGHVDEIRSDGVVVATPAGSHGYAAAADGPLLAPGTGISVVPVAPFRIDRSRWVLPEQPLSVQIRRDEAAITVEVDGEERRTVGQDATVRFEPAAPIETLVVEESEPPFR